MNKSDYEIIHFKNRRNYLLPLVYLKSPNAQSPNLIMVHGGAYKYGNSLQQLDTLKMFQQMGFNVFSLPYSLLPEKWPFAFEDILDGFSYIEKNFSSAKYIIAGRSAGAHLAALLVKEVQPILKNRLLGFINFYGIMDFIDLKNSLKRKNLLKFDRIFEVLFQEKQNDELFLKSISPAHQVDKFFPPTLIFHGSRDSLVPLTQSLIFQNELNKNSIKNELVIFQGVDHVMEWNLYSPCGQIVTQKIELFLNNFKVTTT